MLLLPAVLSTIMPFFVKWFWQGSSHEFNLSLSGIRTHTEHGFSLLCNVHVVREFLQNYIVSRELTLQFSCLVFCFAIPDLLFYGKELGSKTSRIQSCSNCQTSACVYVGKNSLFAIVHLIIMALSNFPWPVIAEAQEEAQKYCDRMLFEFPEPSNASSFHFSSS